MRRGDGNKEIDVDDDDANKGGTGNATVQLGRFTRSIGAQHYAGSLERLQTGNTGRALGWQW